MATITLDTVRKVYAGDVEAVKGVSIDIADSEFIVLVGPSGCGKSTLLRMIAGLEDITTGEIKIGDRLVNKVDPADRDIAMVFQNYALYPHMSVYNNLAYGLKNRGMAKEEIDRRVKEAARILEIGDYLDRKPRALSGGQRQRVAMGRAIVREPAAFLFDEPLSNLDAKLRVQMRVEIKRLQQSLGTTSVYVTHDQLEAMTLADRLVVLNGGNIEQIGAPIEVYDKPASTFVASFIGSPAMNLLNVKADGDGLSLENGAGLSGSNAKGKDSYIVGIRPEHLQVVDGPSSGDGVNLEVSVDVLEPVGAESFVYASFPDGGPEIVVRVSSHARHEPGEKMHLHADAKDVHFFDSSTGRRID
ncbi:MAG: sn-glycerol-3-phosphate import ATP-binding protein UgpC [Roseibium album]|uniref:sn-glycerol-3-phosphate import ATP-binding protein UgpC n=1 Tax=Roseibium album TaxID=311410 RepID=A0A0M7B0Q7_9HYPH|nr:sn-glycerol-3-phosphate import ATP-binding protein UgpC [Roseibium album]MBG6144609.1 sn-glycerol 3-phosphate transport system ATP-binding protein [Labrenzia sp. EL_142]MBG6154373.1 sn-glycerol 3-phosphate transport system ATP-binding protein [Labrenzia sp. EL_162]MBG6161653.1 sn-glycerol 3-phosphate transport system ATP-binding protein [Labrenzia sp. EL_195]MBG6175241.1 sn-glycerol 3-phosphate transport system ATP-binding protein [Labrenzia sp. EL_132]MBG6193498.1 sn-glycerol 3-phosphate t